MDDRRDARRRGSDPRPTRPTRPTGAPRHGVTQGRDSRLPVPQTSEYGRDNLRYQGAVKSRKRMSLGKKLLIGIPCVLLVALIGVGVALALYVNSLDNTMQIKDRAVLEALDNTYVEEEKESPFYMLILGSDSRNGETARSDTIMLARIDPANLGVTLVSIPRDTMIDLPGYGTQKINAAYAYGGAAGSINAVSALAGVPIAHVVEVDFSGFESIVDALGGVTVDVPPNTTYKGVYVPEGRNTINGQQALVFARCRKTYATGDFQRTANQRQLVQAIASDVLKASPEEIPGLVSSLAACVRTDMAVVDLAELALSMRGMDTGAIQSAVVPSYTAMIDGGSYVIAEEAAWAEMMSRVDQGLPPTEAPAEGEG